MEFTEISNEKKLELLAITRSGLVQELYTTLLRLGINPDTFDKASWVEPSPVLTPEEHKITQIISSLELTDEKIASLQ